MISEIFFLNHTYYTIESWMFEKTGSAVAVGHPYSDSLFKFTLLYFSGCIAIKTKSIVAICRFRSCWHTILVARLFILDNIHWASL